MPYEAWRITYQSSEQAARAAHAALQSLGARITALEGELAAAQQAVQAAEGVPSHYRNALPPYRVVSAEEHRAETEHAKHYGLEHLVPRRTPLYTHPTQQGMDAREGRTDAEIVERTEAAARFLLSWAFSQEPEDAKAQLRHSQNTKAQSAWVAACKVQEILTDSDAANAAQEIDCDLPVVPKLPDACDAARYRWLRSRDLETISQGGVFAGMTPENVILNGEDLDEAVDAAIAAQAKQGGAA